MTVKVCIPAMSQNASFAMAAAPPHKLAHTSETSAVCQATRVVPQLLRNSVPSTLLWLLSWLSVWRDRDAQMRKQTAVTSQEKRQQSQSSSTVSSENVAFFVLVFLLFLLSHFCSDKGIYIRQPHSTPPVLSPQLSEGPCEKEEVEL